MRGAFAKSVVYGVREATVDLPIMFWLKERQGLLADFLRNSVDSVAEEAVAPLDTSDRKSTRLNSSHGYISYAGFCLQKKTSNVLRMELPASSHNPPADGGPGWRSS